MSLGKNIKPIKPHTKKVPFSFYDGAKRRCLLACQKASKTRSLRIFSEQGESKKDDHNIWKHFTRNRAIRELIVKIKGRDDRGEAFTDIGRLILLSRNLISLYFNCPNSTSRNNRRLARVWVKSRMLKEFHYKDAQSERTNDDLINLFGHISRMPKLSDFSLSCRLNGVQFDELPEMPVLPSQLTSIGIYIEGLSAFWKNYINAWFLKNKNLKSANLTLVETEQEDSSLDNALKSVSQCNSISLNVFDFITLNGFNSLLQDVPGVFERIRKVKLEMHDNLNASTFVLAVPYLRNLVHFELSLGYSEKHLFIIEDIIEAFSSAPPKSLKTLIIPIQENGELIKSTVTGLQKILKETNLEKLKFYDFLNDDYPLLQIVIDSCFDRPTPLRKLMLSNINLASERIKEIKTENLYFDSLKELDLCFVGKKSKTNQELKNLVHIVSCFKNLEYLSFNFFDPVPKSFFLDLTTLFNTCPLRKFDAFFQDGISDFKQSSLESLVCHSIRTKTLEKMTIHICFLEKQLEGLAPINLDQFKSFDPLLQRHQKLTIKVSDSSIPDIWIDYERDHISDLTKRYQF